MALPTNMKKFLAMFAAAAALAVGQDGLPVNVSSGPPQTPYQQAFTYSGTNLVMQCTSSSVVTTPNRSITPTAITSISKASAAVVTVSGGHGINLSTLPTVTISGATGTGWTGINGTFVATPINTTTFSVPVNSSGFGTLGGTVQFTSTAPLLNQPVWFVKLFVYDGSNNLLSISNLAGGQPSVCASSSTINNQ